MLLQLRLEALWPEFLRAFLASPWSSFDWSSSQAFWSKPGSLGNSSLYSTSREASVSLNNLFVQNRDLFSSPRGTGKVSMIIAIFLRFSLPRRLVPFNRDPVFAKKTPPSPFNRASKIFCFNRLTLCCNWAAYAWVSMTGPRRSCGSKMARKKYVYEVAQHSPTKCQIEMHQNCVLLDAKEKSQRQSPPTAHDRINKQIRPCDYITSRACKGQNIAQVTKKVETFMCVVIACSIL